MAKKPIIVIDPSSGKRFQSFIEVDDTTGELYNATTSQSVSNAILAGAGAPSNAQGNVGDIYIDQNSPNNWYQKDNTNVWVQKGFLQGSNGATGTPGAQFRTGAGAPANTLGVDGDLYLDTATDDVYQRAAGVYTVQGNIKGNTGATGPQGVEGTQFRTGFGAPANTLGVDGDLYLDLGNANIHFRSGGIYSVQGNIKGGQGLTGAPDCPVGSISLWAGSSLPSDGNWILADGSVVAISSYPDLYSEIGTTYNTGGEGTGNFRLPDPRGRTFIGAGTGAGLTARTLGQTLGEENHTLSIAEMPSHHHQIHTWNGYGNGPGVDAANQGTTEDAFGAGYSEYTGGSSAHNNMQPSFVVNFIIRVKTSQYLTQWKTGHGVPTGTSNNADMYLNLDNGDIYQYSSSGATWGSVLENIHGTPGTKFFTVANQDPNTATFTPSPIAGDLCLDTTTGATYLYSTTWTASGSLKGPQGTAGNFWRTGVGAPSSTAGVAAGDMYLDMLSGDVYQLVSGAYVKQGNIKGGNLMAGLEIGGIAMWSGASLPASGDWLWCDGSIVSQSTYSDLYSVVGTSFNTGGEGTGNFRLPDSRGRTPIGTGTGTGLTIRTLGQMLGEETHVLTIAEMPSHTHTMNELSYNTGGSTGGTFGSVNGTVTTNATGGGAAHNNMQPSLGVGFIVRWRISTPAAQWHTGHGAPAAGLGVINDMYLDLDTGNVYQKTSQSAWSASLGSIQGGASLTLNNLLTPTAINQNLLPGTDNTLTSGNGTYRWAEVHGNRIYTSELIAEGATSITINDTAVFNSTILANGSVLLEAGAQCYGTLAMNSQAIQGLLDPVNPQDAATKHYVDTQLSSLANTKIAQTIFVAKNGLDTNDGSFNAPFLTVQAAINSITDAAAGKQYLIKVSAGVYAETGLTFKPFVHIMGDARANVSIYNSNNAPALYNIAGAVGDGSSLVIQGVNLASGGVNGGLLVLRGTGTTGASIVIDDCFTGPIIWNGRGNTSDSVQIKNKCDTGGIILHGCSASAWDSNLSTFTLDQVSVAANIKGALTSGSAQITGISFSNGAWANVVNGQALVGLGIPNGTTISSFDSVGGTITMSANATVTGTEIIDVGTADALAASSISAVGCSFTTSNFCGANTVANIYSSLMSAAVNQTGNSSIVNLRNTFLSSAYTSSGSSAVTSATGCRFGSTFTTTGTTAPQVNLDAISYPNGAVTLSSQTVVSKYTKALAASYSASNGANWSNLTNALPGGVTVADALDNLAGDRLSKALGGTMGANIDMGTHSILNVVDPVNPQDAATKHYVDVANSVQDVIDGSTSDPSSAAIGTTFAVLSGAHQFYGYIGTTSGTVNVGDVFSFDIGASPYSYTAIAGDTPQTVLDKLRDLVNANAAEIVTAGSDTAPHLFFTAKAADTNFTVSSVSATLIPGGPQNSFIGHGGSLATKQSNGQYTFDTSHVVGFLVSAKNNGGEPKVFAQNGGTWSLVGEGNFLKLIGGTMSGAIDLGSHSINNVTDPTLAQDAATKNYADTKLALTGGSMSAGANISMDATAAINMNGGAINMVGGVINHPILASSPALGDNLDANGHTIINVSGMTFGSTATIEFASDGTDVVNCHNTTFNGPNIVSPQLSQVVSIGFNLGATLDLPADGSGAINMHGGHINGTPVLANGADMGSSKITSVADPGSPQDAATKNYVDTTLVGLTVNIQPSIDGAQSVGISTKAFSGIVLKDQSTGQNYLLTISNGALSFTPVP